MHNLKYVVGPHHINNNHWVAVLVDITAASFQVINPKGQSFSLSKSCYDSWIDYYYKRPDATITDWKHNVNTTQHPIQSDNDNWNCGVFVCLIIEHFVKSQLNSFSFPANKADLKSFRQRIASILELNQSR